MIGLIQKILLDLVEEKTGIEGIEELKIRAQIPVDRVFRIGEVYSDVECRSLFEAAADVLHMDEEQMFAAYAHVFFSDALRRFPKWFTLAKNSRMFLEFQTKIHNTFASGVVDPVDRQAVKDKFRIENVDDKRIITHYRSPNKFCRLYKALANWIAGYYGDEIRIDEPKCMLRGDSECELHVTWTHLKGESQNALQ